MNEVRKVNTRNPRPEWLSIRLNSGEEGRQVMGCISDLKLGTVCSSAKCPNQSECFGKGRATFLLMGPSCTRRCGFCAVERNEPSSLDPSEPERVAQAVSRLKLTHAVITSVTRDDLHDGGAGHFVATVEAVRGICPEVTVEILVPDFAGNIDAWSVSAASLPDVYNHNLETVERLYGTVRPIASYSGSLEQLKFVKEKYPEVKTKSGMMVGLGESYEEIIAAAKDLRAAKVDMITVGQYLCPVGSKNLPVEYYMPPEEFKRLEHDLQELGFSSVAASPFVRSSYNAGENFKENC